MDDIYDANDQLFITQSFAQPWQEKTFENTVGKGENTVK